VVHEVASTSLVDRLEEPGFRSSVITTYNCYFPFYEEVVLRRLIAAGCTHNVLLADADQCAKAYACNELRPRRAGRDYTLIPVKIGGAFHPKVFLRLGKAKGSLFVGSHNVTLSGFGVNDEITNIFQVEGSGIRTGVAPLRQAYEYLASFVPTSLPDLVEAFEGLRLGIQWMSSPLVDGGQDRVLLTTSSSTADLWSQVAPLIPSNVTTAMICAPFFDPTLTLVRRIQREVRPQSLVVGIDPASVEIEPTEAAALANVRWVNIAGIPRIPKRRTNSSHYPHAKIFWFAGENAELLVSGSANPSIAAFLAPPPNRNAEVCVADSRNGAGAEIGIDALLEAPPITDCEWASVKLRRASEPAGETEPSRRILIATPSPTGFITQDALPIGLALRGIGENNFDLGKAIVREPTLIEAEESVRDNAHYLGGHEGNTHFFILLHRTEEIAENMGGDSRKALQQVLGGLGEDPSQLEALLKITEKVIFDSDDIMRTSSLRATPEPRYNTEEATSQDSLALEAAGRKSARHKRSLASGDLVILLDALTRRLGEGLLANATTRSLTVQEEIDADEEDGGELAREMPDLEALGRTCRNKVRRLIKRLEGQLELADSIDRPIRSVVQLAAVLGVVHALRQIEQRPEWRRAHAVLIDPDSKSRLFETGVLALAWGDKALAPRAVTEAGGVGFDELSLVAGLLAWLAWDTEVDLEKALGRAGREGVENDAWYFIQLFAALGPWLSTDNNASAIFETSVRRTLRFAIDADKWLLTHRTLATSFALIAADPDHHGKLGRLPQPGDLVILNNGESPRVRVILDVTQGTSGVKVTFLGRENPEAKDKREFLATRVVTVPWT
jgi:hypothetical protein